LNAPYIAPHTVCFFPEWHNAVFLGTRCEKASPVVSLLNLVYVWQRLYVHSSLELLLLPLDQRRLCPQTLKWLFETRMETWLMCVDICKNVLLYRPQKGLTLEVTVFRFTKWQTRIDFYKYNN